ncbi:aldehyde dehydrogenase family protein [Actinomadura madurae]|uniref:aldehyde dehydrogenase family protein n=1 Tax=Actinomadura madurae TaxID=1993 RepID=UPI0020D2547E|nr:aldehyde dehydrogenase family protein [Actinomadura madurae]MCP9951440.1 aldehyde dehydrogenase family protein [Actinomadura madurae]MCQ0016871.1 aldehyde dehydrogenase family protein [Actinomadura madurae]
MLPPGVLNVLHGFGPDAAGEHLVRSEHVNLVTFTGESRTGSAVMSAAAPTLKRVSFELGGKSPNIVFADADLDSALEGTLHGIFMNQGEICLAGSRLYVQRPVYDEFLNRLVERARGLRIGDPLDPSTEVGPLVSAEHLERVRGYLDLAAAEGARFLAGGALPGGPGLDQGSYLEPTIIEGLAPGSRCMQEEIFGPVLVVAPFDTEAEAVALANGTPYGLAAMVWTTDLGRAHRMSERIIAGQVWVNCFFARDLRTPFGGAKRSGIGREGGLNSREFFTEPKTVTISLAASSVPVRP